MGEKSIALFDIKEISGVGDVTGNEMRALNYRWTRDLFLAPVIVVSDDLEPIVGVSRNEIQNQFIPQARLLELPGITPSLASHLCDKNYRKYSQVGWVDEAHLKDAILEHSPDFDESLISEIQREALRRASTCSLRLKVMATDSSPISGAEFHVSNPSPSGFPHGSHWVSDEHGVIYTDYLAPGFITSGLIADGYLSKIHPIVVEFGMASSQAAYMEVGQSSPVIYDEFESGHQMYLNQFAVSRQTVSIEDLPDNAVFEFHSAGDSINLICMQRRHVGSYAEHYLVSVELDEFFSELEAGSIVERDSAGNWSVRTGATRYDWHISSPGGA